MKQIVIGIGLVILAAVIGYVSLAGDDKREISRTVPMERPDVFVDGRLAAVSEESRVDEPVALPAQSTERVTKKPFGIRINPETSPVQPERFQGYHTGTDFETFLDEATIDVPVHAICDGPLIMKRLATGYGGVAVQGCMLDNQAVTVVYGHLRLSSIGVDIGTTLKRSDMLGMLGTGYTEETSGERKHLHLGIHKGEAVNILGYVASKQELNQWIDPCRFVCGNSNQ
jgi:murein DD-endopeptidase MepM/ murein hydrolase activator NlpD